MSDADDLSAARAALRERQGVGARYDAANAPHRELAWVRRGNAYFARKLNELRDDELKRPARRPNLSRQRVAAEVAYQARAFARMAEMAHGVPQSDPGDDLTFQDELEWGATLPAGALRHLVAHAEVHLNVCWRDLRAEEWDRLVDDGAGGSVTPRETVWPRARRVWLAAIELGNGGSFRDLPLEVLLRLIEDGLVPQPRRGPAFRHDIAAPPDAGALVRGLAAPAAAWLCGLGDRGGLVAAAARIPS